jgi:DNA-binding NarL/FixJ family response regulator
MVLDVTIPGASSVEVMAEARRSARNTKIVLTSAYDLKRTPFAEAAANIACFIRKPFGLADLVELLRSVLSTGSSDPAASAGPQGESVYGNL